MQRLPGRLVRDAAYEAESTVRWEPDEIDRWLMQWAIQRRQIEGLAPLEPKDRLGKLASTLGAVREDGEGASQGVTSQSFPEVYTGTALLVHRAICEMDRRWACVVSLHFVRRDWRVRDKARLAGVDVAMYWKHLALAKNYVHAFVTICTKYEAKTQKVMETQFFPSISGSNGLARWKESV
jgi:hypothetical protein